MIGFLSLISNFGTDVFCKKRKQSERGFRIVVKLLVLERKERNGMVILTVACGWAGAVFMVTTIWAEAERPKAGTTKIDT